METNVHLLLALAVCLLHIPNAFSATWNDPPFLPAHDRPEIEFVDMGPGNDGQIIFMDEEMGPMRIAEINYAGSGTPSIGRIIGSTIYLDGKIVKDGDKWFVEVGDQDFETPAMQRYTFDVLIQEGSVVMTGTIFLNIRNIDDNPPVIESSTCQVPELYKGITDCTYVVTDADGPISIDVMRFNIDKVDERAIFNIRESEKTAYRMRITLETVIELDFDRSQLHTFTLMALDSLPNNGIAFAVVQVIDVPNMPPVWKTLFASQRFDEKTAQQFDVLAVDGDTQINKDIHYKLTNHEEFAEYFSIGETTGKLIVNPINRDLLQREMFTFNITAFKDNCENTNGLCEESATVFIIIDDINDNIPDPNFEIFELTIPEETYLPIDFEPSISFNDIDLGDNAQYRVSLLSVTPAEAANAFMLIPNTGYQQQNFSIAIVNAGLLDFDDEKWQIVELEIEAVEIVAPFGRNKTKIRITLENWNDELPIFENTSLITEFEETAPAGYIVGTLHATDRDIGDHVIHKIVGDTFDYLSIDESTGLITVNSEDAFDYQRQKQIIVQISAEDVFIAPRTHIVYAQLIINLIDVNNKAPTIQMPRVTPTVEENVPDGYEILKNNQFIIGRDPDSTAEIEFSINWDESFATKQSRRVNEAEYVNCVEIKTIYPNPGDTKYAEGHLIVREIRNNVTIDFEEFDFLNLVIGLKDNNQTLGTNYVEGMLTITIEDLNDNRPEWVNGSLETRRFVREVADSDISIGSVQAIDIDGPEFNVVKYFIKPINDTPEGWVKIHLDSGQLSVDGDRLIDADVPPREYLYYEITATDCHNDTDTNCHHNPGNIEIFVIDTNNKFPEALVDEFDFEVEVCEAEQTGYHITTIKSLDLDREEIYNNVKYTIDYRLDATLRKFFKIDLDNGTLYVDLEDENMDRDNGIEFYNISIILTDNIHLEGDTAQRSNTTWVYITLLDANDNAPIFPHPDDIDDWIISEDAKKDTHILPNITAHDNDKPGTDNSFVFYEVLNLTAKFPPDKDFPSDLIQILSPNNVSGILYANYDLKGYYGTYDITLLARDWGIPQQNSTAVFEITITPFNYHKPEFTFPRADQTIRLTEELAKPDTLLYYTDGRPMDDIHATDKDGLEAGEVTFAIVGPAEEYFRIANLENNSGRLFLTQDIEGISSFDVTIRATDKGKDPGPEQTDISVKILFINTKGFPFYVEKTQIVAFTEGDTGLGESHKMYEAEDEKNIGCNNNDPEDDKCLFDIYYYIIDGFAMEHFKLHNVNNILEAIKPLNRSESIVHTFRIAATNDATAPEVVSHPDSVLTVTVQVKELDPRPRFELDVYTAGISMNFDEGRTILEVNATHSEDFPMEYSIDGPIIADPSLEPIKDNAFSLNKNTGVFTLTFKPMDYMNGMFEFNVKATDNVSKSDTSEVKIFMVGNNNRVIFIFENTQEEVHAKQNELADILGRTFLYLCLIDDIGRANDETGNVIEGLTRVVTHFIDDNNLPVEAGEIEKQLDNVALMRQLREALLREDLTLEDFGSNNQGNQQSESLERMLQIILIVVSTVLGGLCIALLVAYCIRTKSLNKRLKDLTETQFGSTNSGLQRGGVAVPGTNKHAFEGSNPVWKEEITAPQFDQISNASGDSDLIGIEDSPQFAYENKK